MNDRKQHVIKMAHQLFIEKGFQATSIQDILDYSGISKGTFYNYFSSKNELLMAIFKTIHAQLEVERNEMLIGQDRSDIEIFKNQIEMQMKATRKNKLIPLFEEVMVSNDAELKKFIEQGRLRNIQWLYQRFIDIFGENKKPCLLDCAIMFMGILRENIKFNSMANGKNLNIGQVVRFSVNRLVNMVGELSESGDQLIQPELLERWLPSCKNVKHLFQRKFQNCVVTLKNSLPQIEDQTKYLDLLDFIEGEIFDSEKPRKFLIDSALLSLQAIRGTGNDKEFQHLEQLVEDYFNK